MEGEPKEITSKSHEIGSPFLYSISIVKEPGLTTCFFHCYKGLLFGLMVTCGANCWIGNIILALVLKWDSISATPKLWWSLSWRGQDDFHYMYYCTRQKKSFLRGISTKKKGSFKGVRFWVCSYQHYERVSYRVSLIMKLGFATWIFHSSSPCENLIKGLSLTNLLHKLWFLLLTQLVLVIIKLLSGTWIVKRHVLGSPLSKAIPTSQEIPTGET